jgi:DNA-binding winged helix-turn-helix (wHTH) protein/Tfp pilus assembly protein PilF
MVSGGNQTTITVGGWLADRAAGRLTRDGLTHEVEPKVMDLLFLLASRPGEVFPREDIFAALWPGVSVGDDSLARCVWKLRQIVGDDPKQPYFIETIAKRGYRLIAPVEIAAHPRRWRLPVVIGLAGLVAIGIALAIVLSSPVPVGEGSAAAMTRRAEDFYYQFTRADNEAAIELYDRALAADPDYAPALAGMANALVQRVLRWPNPASEPDLPRTDLSGALRAGRTDGEDAKSRLSRALNLAERAVRLAPDTAAAHKALGSVYGAQARFDLALESYRHAVALDADNWGALIDLGDISEITGDRTAAIGYFEQAYAAMSRVYDREAPRVRPWQADLGVLIGDRYLAQGRPADAEAWYRRVLAQTPFHRGATLALARLLTGNGDAASAAELCRKLSDHAVASPGCGER